MGGLTNIDWYSRKAEISFLDSTKRSKQMKLYQTDFNSFIFLIKTIAFENLKLHRLFTETFDFRKTHIGVLERNGFIYEGCLKEHKYIKNKYVDSLLHGLIYEKY